MTLSAKGLTVNHPIESFQIPTEWDQSLSLILTGETGTKKRSNKDTRSTSPCYVPSIPIINKGTGKTALSKALLPNALLVNHVDRLREYMTSQRKGVIFDDMNFLHYPRESHIHLTDTGEDRDIHGRNVNGMLPAGTPRIFTTNNSPAGILNVSDPAVARRCTAWQVDSPKEIKVLF